MRHLEKLKGCVVEHSFTWEKSSGMVVLNEGQAEPHKETICGVLCQRKSGEFYVDDKTYHCIKRTINPGDDVVLVFTPHERKVSHLCQKCFKELFTSDQQRALRSLNFQCRTYKCSICKKVPKYDGLIVRMGLVATMPLWSWEFDLQGLLAYLDSQQKANRGAHLLESSHVYDGAEFYIQSAQRDFRDLHSFKWELNSKTCSAHVTAEMPRPPHNEEWSKYTTWDELKLIAGKLQYRGSNTCIYWAQGEAERSFQV